MKHPYLVIFLSIVIFSSSFVMASVSEASIVDITPEWLSTNGPSPYYLNQANTTYVLQTDVETPGTAFVILKDYITFDLNGHTITYDNSIPITIQNGGFEQGSGRSIPGWILLMLR